MPAPQENRDCDFPFRFFFRLPPFRCYFIESIRLNNSSKFAKCSVPLVEGFAFRFIAFSVIWWVAGIACHRIDMQSIWTYEICVMLDGGFDLIFLSYDIWSSRYFYLDWISKSVEILSDIA